MLKCQINGVEVNAKVTENLGLQGGYRSKAVEYEGKEYIVVFDKGVWRRRSADERLGIVRSE